MTDRELIEQFIEWLKKEYDDTQAIYKKQRKEFNLSNPHDSYSLGEIVGKELGYEKCINKLTKLLNKQ